MRTTLALACLASLAIAAPASAQSYLARPLTIGGNPGPAHNYICPNHAGGGAIDCYLDAVRHLYTMCRHVKSIEISEHGYQRAEEGTNAAKSQSCVDKQKQNIAKPYQTALRDFRQSKPTTEGLRDLHDFWVASLAGLKWRNGENDEDYLVRTGLVYSSLDEKIDGVRVSIVESRVNAAVAKSAPAKVRR